MVVLAGGRSSRMGEDKGLKEIDGKPMISYLLHEFFEEEVCINTKDMRYKKFRCELIPDLVNEKGPMGGIFSSFKNLSDNFLFFIPCDAPKLKKIVFQLLLENHFTEGVTVAKYKNQLYPTIAIYPRSLMIEMEKCILKNHLSLKRFIEDHPCKIIDFEGVVNKEVFVNINSQNDIVVAYGN